MYMYGESGIVQYLYACACMVCVWCSMWYVCGICGVYFICMVSVHMSGRVYACGVACVQCNVVCV